MKTGMIAVLAFIMTVGIASADVLVTESFDYGDHDDTTKFLRTSEGHNGGTGWAVNWYATNGEGVRLDKDGTNTLVYPEDTTLTASGGRINDSLGGASTRTFESSLPDDSYFSCLINWSGGSMQIKMGNGTYDRWIPLNVNADGQLTTGVSGLTTEYVQISSNVNYLVAARRTRPSPPDFNRTVNTTVFEVNSPGAFLTEPTSWDLTNSGVSGVSMALLTVNVVNAGDKMVDEIRIGTTYEDVVGNRPPGTVVSIK